MKKMLICGANGQLGRELQDVLHAGKAPIGPIDPSWSDWLIVATDVDELDICDEAAVQELFEREHFDIIVNCAAATNVDGCETNYEFAHKLNAKAPEILARAAASIDAVLMHISTDYVLAGDDEAPQDELAPCRPNTAYGKTKLAGEQAVAKLCPRHFIVRTSWLYGTHGKNFVETMIRLGKSHESITVVCDQHGTPTFAGDLAWEMLALLKTDAYGTYHCTGNGATTWDVFAARIMSDMNLDCTVIPVSTEDYTLQHPQSAPRPAWSILDNKRLRETIGDNMRPWEDALDEFLSERA